MLDFVKNNLLQKSEYSNMKTLINRNNYCDLLALVDVVNFVKYRLNKQNIRMLEVGSCLGESSAVFAQNVGELYCIDAWDINMIKWDFEINRWKDKMPDIEHIFDLVCNEYSNIHKIKGESLKEVNNFEDGFFDFIYIDAEHSYESVKADLLAWKSKTTKYIGGHDYQMQFMGVVQAVNEIFNSPLAIFIDSSYICEVK